MGTNSIENASQSSACGIHDSACGLQNNACGLQNDAFRIQTSACGASRAPPLQTTKAAQIDAQAV